MKRKLQFLKTLLVAVGLSVGSMSAWSATVSKTYDFETYSKSLTANYTLMTNELKPETSLTVDGQTCYVFNNISGDFWFDHRFAAQVGSKDTYGWMIQKNNSLYSSCGGSRKLAVLGLKKGDKITFNFTIGTDASATVTFGTTNISEDGTTPVTSGTNITTGTEYTVLSDGNIAINVGRYYHFQTITIETDEVYAAIWDTKQNDTSDEYATYIDGKLENGDLTTVENVYSAYTAYQISQGVVTDGMRDITNVIRNATVADAAATNWTGATTYKNEQYTGAPDIYFIDRSGSKMWATQTLYGLPAGSYVVKAATRANADTYTHIYVSNGTEDIGRVQGNHVGNSGGDLGNGWGWTEVPFTIAETTNIILGFYCDAETSGYWGGCDDWHLYRVETVSATIPSSGFGTIASAYALDCASLPSGVTAYKVSELSASSVKLEEVTTAVAAGTGLILNGAAGPYSIPVAASGTDISGTNLLKAAVNATAIDANTAYILKGGEFHLVNAASTVPAGKAYLLADDVTAPSLNFVFGGETTGINSVEAGEVLNGAFYNLNGQRVAAPGKGLYIVNGKKVIIK